jgi:hypothetical protein
MIDLVSERRIGLHEAAKIPPSFREGKPTHVSTVLRWITKGVKLANGEVVRLEGARCGGRWTTSVEAVARFMERLTAGTLATRRAPSHRHPARPGNAAGIWNGSIVGSMRRAFDQRKRPREAHHLSRAAHRDAMAQPRGRRVQP